MSAPSHDADVIPLRPIADRLADDPEAPPVNVEKYDRSYEVDLDEEHDDARVLNAVPVDMPPVDVERRPIIPLYLRSWDGVKATAERESKRIGHIVAYHAVRAPFIYLPLALFWALVGLFKVAGRQIRWWWRSEAAPLKREAIIDNDPLTYSKLDRDDRSVRLYRGIVLGLQLVALLVATVLLVHAAPLWLQILVLVVLVPVLAHAGRPADRPIVSPALVKPRFRRINADIVLFAYYAAKLGDPDKPDQQVDFGSRMSRDHMNTGTQVVVDLPRGKTFADAVAAKDKLASGLDVTEYQVFLTRDKTSTRRHLLFVADSDPLAIPAGLTPMLDCKPRDVWRPCFIGLDERGRRVCLDLLWNSILIGAQPRKGKALALDTPVPTPAGWSTMGELRDGDWVYDETGKPCRVVTAHEVRHGRPCYEVVFSDGSVIVADAEHLWQVDTRASRLGAQQRGMRAQPNRPSLARDQSARWAMPKVLTTDDMLGSVRIQADGRANYSVRVAAPLQGDDADLLIPPYTLGAWLGDGTTVNGTITCQDEEIISMIEAEGERAGLIPSSVASGRCATYRVYGLHPRLRQIGVLGDKHIPVAYLRASEAQRRALLAGLLDTDGYCQDTGVVYFAVTSERLAREVRHLVSTLGYKSSLNCKPARLNGKDCGEQWVVTFTPADKVFGLARKAARQVTSTKASAGHRFITEIRPVPSVPVRCITVDSLSSLYLVGETCIPTHNTFTARLLALYAALDPWTKLFLADGKNSPDWRMFALVADRMVFGVAPSALDGDPVEKLLDMLRYIRKHIDRVNVLLSEIARKDPAACPEGKLTRKLARDPRYPELRVWVLVIEEFQVYFETDDQERNKEIAGHLSDIMARGPSSGVILLDSSQKPSGVGAGDVQRLFNRFRDNHAVRIALKCGNRNVSEAVLGGDAYAEGYDASALPIGPEYRGVGYLYGASDDTPLVRHHFADGPAATKILTAARAHRERLGLLTGEAAGDITVEGEVVDWLGDVLAVVPSTVSTVSFPRLAALLRDQIPQRYEDVDAASVSARMRSYGIKGKSVKDRDFFPGGTGQGVARSAVEQVAAKQAVSR